MSLRVLVADDSEVMRGRILGPLMKMPGGAEIVAECTNGLEALEAARKFKPDIALLDVQMILMTGMEAAKAMREENLCKVLLVTSMGQRASAKSGEFPCLIKPFSSTQLYHAIFAALEKKVPSIGKVLDNLAASIVTGIAPYQPNLPPTYPNPAPTAGQILSTIVGVGHPLQYHVTTRLENHLAQVGLYATKEEKLYPYINRDTAELVEPLGPIPPIPTVSEVSGGTNPALTYYVVIVYYNGTTETGAGSYALIPVDANNFLRVASPPALTGYTQYRVYAALSAIGPYYPQSGYVNVGTAWTQSGAFVATGSPPLPQQYQTFYAVGRSLKNVFIEVWGPTRHDRDSLADVIRAFMTDAFRQTEIDGTVSLFRYGTINDLDMEERDTIYVRQIIYQVDFVVTQAYGETQVESAMATLTVDPLLTPLPPGSGS